MLTINGKEVVGSIVFRNDNHAVILTRSGFSGCDSDQIDVDHFNPEGLALDGFSSNEYSIATPETNRALTEGQTLISMDL